jgi:hypothetical protein
MRRLKAGRVWCGNAHEHRIEGRRRRCATAYHFLLAETAERSAGKNRAGEDKLISLRRGRGLTLVCQRHQHALRRGSDRQYLRSKADRYNYVVSNLDFVQRFSRPCTIQFRLFDVHLTGLVVQVLQTMPELSGTEIFFFKSNIWHLGDPAHCTSHSSMMP